MIGLRRGDTANPRRRALIFGAGLLALAGCAGLPATGTVAPASRREFAAFGLEGRISVKQGETRHHALISWQHQAERDQILLSSPLGQGLAELTREGTEIRLLTAEREEFRGADWGELAQRFFGAPLPVEELPRWLVAAVDAPVADVLGRPASLVAGGWRIDWLEYDSAEAQALPVRVEIRRGDVEVLLRIDAWTVAP